MTVSPPDTRASLIMRLRDGADVQAWDEFVELYGSVVFRSARRKGLQPADADDLVQEVFTAVARSVDRWVKREDRGSFRAWLFRIARNTAIDFLTRRKHQPWSEGGRGAAENIDRAYDATCDFDLEYRREIFTRASEIVRARVSETNWQAFYRTSVEQETIDRVAHSLGISVGNVYVARSRVMKRLQNLVQTFEEMSDDV